MAMCDLGLPLEGQRRLSASTSGYIGLVSCWEWLHVFTACEAIVTSEDGRLCEVLICNLRVQQQTLTWRGTIILGTDGHPSALSLARQQT